jgi:hypothetical protein
LAPRVLPPSPGRGRRHLTYPSSTRSADVATTKAHTLVGCSALDLLRGWSSQLLASDMHVICGYHRQDHGVGLLVDVDVASGLACKLLLAHRRVRMAQPIINNL